jgi:hypothetical protein
MLSYLISMLLPADSHMGAREHGCKQFFGRLD